MFNLRRQFQIWWRNVSCDGFVELPDLSDPNSNQWRRARFIATASETPTASPHGSAGRRYQVVVAATREMGIAKDGKIPWYLPTDLKFFKELTRKTSDPQKQNAVLMGRKTWESLPTEHRPLRGRLNIALTRSGNSNLETTENVTTCGSLSSALELLSHNPTVEKAFVIGGGQVLREALNGPMCEAIHVTWIETSFQCDTFIPSIHLSCFRLWHSSLPLVENGVKFCFATYVRVRKSSEGESCDGVDGVKEFSFLPEMILQRGRRM